MKWTIRFLPPVEPAGGNAADDPLWVLERTEAVRTTIQEALHELLAERDSMW